MLFNSYAFIFAFLPGALLLFHGCRYLGLDRGAILVLTLLSLFFYGWWNHAYLLLLVPLILANFVVALGIVRLVRTRHSAAKLLFVAGLVLNLGVLAYFKYANFFLETVNAVRDRESLLAQVVLPLGISFFVFQKVAFLSDVFQRKVERVNLLDFALFVTFFPQLIAGPIVHHREMLPQFLRALAPCSRLVAMGVTIFGIGLAKKVLLADTAARYVAAPFAAAASGAPLDLLTAWSGALAYTAQLYFDFSGYSDMAIGAALLFGIRLPVNFASPYKATSIIEFWRRWHITLSRLLRDYLYVPLGGSRFGPTRRYPNLFVTVLLGGLWHGAGWTFIVWGALHGAYLAINHGWRVLWRSRPGATTESSPAGQLAGAAVTFVAVVVGWVLFRASDMAAAIEMLKAMAGLYGIGSAAGGEAAFGLAVAGSMLLIAFAAPNTQELTGYRGPATEDDIGGIEVLARWQPSLRWGVAVGGVFALAVMSLSRVSEFLYFQF